MDDNTTSFRRVNLTDHDDKFVTDLVASGQFPNDGEVLRVGLRLLELQAHEDVAKLMRLRSLAAEGFDALDRGEGITLDGEQQLAEYIGGLGRKAAARSTAPSNGE